MRAAVSKLGFMQRRVMNQRPWAPPRRLLHACTVQPVALVEALPLPIIDGLSIITLLRSTRFMHLSWHDWAAESSSWGHVDRPQPCMWQDMCMSCPLCCDGKAWDMGARVLALLSVHSTLTVSTFRIGLAGEASNRPCTFSGWALAS